MIHAEHGLIGIRGSAGRDEEDPDLTDAGKNFVTLQAGAAAFDSSVSFAIVRSGRLDLTIMGGLQVSEGGDLANWVVPGRGPGVGGAMDLAIGARQVWIVMDHVDRFGNPKLVRHCTFPLTGANVVHRVYTTLAVFEFVHQAMTLIRFAPGVTESDVRSVTEASYRVSPLALR
jgi:3-oxoacid CoA-transferase B subunit